MDKIRVVLVSAAKNPLGRFIIIVLLSRENFEKYGQNWPSIPSAATICCFQTPKHNLDVPKLINLTSNQQHCREQTSQHSKSQMITSCKAGLVQHEMTLGSPPQERDKRHRTTHRNVKTVTACYLPEAITLFKIIKKIWSPSLYKK